MKLSKFNVYYEGAFCFVANTLTGVCIVLTLEEQTKLKNEWFHDFSNEEIKIFYENGIIVESELNEIQLLRNAYNQCKYSNQKANITITPSLDCNFNCVYCYENRTKTRMNFQVQNACVAFIEKLIRENNISELNVCWYGGEPLLNIDVIESISIHLIQFCKEENIVYSASIITNGYLITKDMANRLKECKVRSAQVTVDGSEDIHNKRRMLKGGGSTYDRVCNGINILAEMNVNVFVRVNLDKSNIVEYADVCNRFNGHSQISCYPALVTEEDTESVCQKALCYSHKEYADFYNKVNLFGNDKDYVAGVYNCAAEHEYSYVISPDGYLYKCLNDICNCEYAIGHVLKDINGSLAAAKYMGRDPFTEYECGDCPYMPICYGGCVFEYKKHNSHACKAVKFMYIKQCLKKIGGD